MVTKNLPTYKCEHCLEVYLADELYVIASKNLWLCHSCYDNYKKTVMACVATRLDIYLQHQMGKEDFASLCETEPGIARVKLGGKITGAKNRPDIRDGSTCPYCGSDILQYAADCFEHETVFYCHCLKCRGKFKREVLAEHLCQYCGSELTFIKTPDGKWRCSFCSSEYAVEELGERNKKKSVLKPSSGDPVWKPRDTKW